MARAHSMTSIQPQPSSPYSTGDKRHSSHIIRQLHDVSEISAKLSAREIGSHSSSRKDLQQDFNKEFEDLHGIQDGDKTPENEGGGESQDASKSSKKDFPFPLEHRPIKSILDEIPRPKFSTKSPSSPAKLSSLPKQLPISPLKAVQVYKPETSSYLLRQDSGGNGPSDHSASSSPAHGPRRGSPYHKVRQHGQTLYYLLSPSKGVGS